MGKILKWTNEAIEKEFYSILKECELIEIQREPYKTPKIFLKCNKGHSCVASWNNILHNKKCPHCAKNKKQTTEEVKEYIKNEIKFANLELLDNYINNRTPLTLIDEENYKYYVRLDNLKINKFALKFHKNNIYTIYNIHNYLKLNNIQYKLLANDYKDNNTKMLWECCSKHQFLMTWGNFQQGERCPHCSNNKKLTIEFIKKEFEERDFILISEKYYSNSSPLKFLCKKHLNIGVQNVNWSTFKDGVGCKYCYYDYLRETRKMGLNTFKQRVYDLVKYEYTVISESYINNSKAIIMRHSICNHEYEVTPVNFLQGGRRCPYCSNNKSKGEDRILKFLANNNISYILQHTFEDCKYKNVLRFDFYIPYYNLICEYQGIQHYEPIDFASKGEDWAKEQFKENQIKDQIKRDFCKTNNIKLLEISYWDFDNIEDILNKELSG